MKTWRGNCSIRVGLGDRLDHRPAELSGGERQRVAVARLIHRPVLLLADEPTGNLDRRTAASVGKLLLDLHREEQNILVVVTHSLELADLFPRMLGDGRRLDSTPTGIPAQKPASVLDRHDTQTSRLRNLLFHWRGNLAVFLGVVVGTAVLDRPARRRLRCAAALRQSKRCGESAGSRKPHRCRGFFRLRLGRRFGLGSKAGESMSVRFLCCKPRWSCAKREKGGRDSDRASGGGVTVMGVDDRSGRRSGSGGEFGDKRQRR